MSLCRNPWMQGMQAFPCGSCMPCLFNRRRTWAHRMMLEAKCHADASLLTLTYSDENMPLTRSGSATLEPRHLQLFMKRMRAHHAARVASLRLNINPSLRFYAVGEYSDAFRPHYHAILFGLAACVHGRTRNWRNNCCTECDLVRVKWGFGRIESRTVDVGGCEYVAKYVTKKMTRADDPRLDGRYPEFARMSLRPGIGRDAMHEVASELLSVKKKMDDVPVSLKHGEKAMPLGRYLRKNLRLMVGRDAKAPPLRPSSEMLALRYAARADEDDPSFKSKVVKASAGKAASLEARMKIKRQRKTLDETQ